MASTSGIPFVAGAMNQNGAVYLPSGQPYILNGQQVLDPNGLTKLWSVGNPNPPSAPPPAVNLPGSAASYTPLSPPTIGTPNNGLNPFNGTGSNPAGSTNTTGSYLPPEIQALRTIRQISPNYLKLSKNLQAQYLQQLTNASNGQLPPGVQREVQQQVAAQEAGTGNTAGVAQAVQQGMTTGEAGLNYYQGVLNQANSYLGSGTNPYAIGSSYVNNALNQQNAALSGGQVTYNPYGTAPAFSYINPNTGAEFAQGETGFLNAGVGATAGSPDTTGQLAGSAIGATGAIIGGLAAAGAFCWVAREVYGAKNPKWLRFRDWITTRAPRWLFKLYAKYGQKFSQWLRYRPTTKTFIRLVMDTILAVDSQQQNHKLETK